MAFCIQCGEAANFYEEGYPLRSFCYASCQLIGQDFEGLTNDAVISIWLKMDLVDITAFCQVNKRFRALCHSERFTGPYFRNRTDILEQLGKFMKRNVTADFAFWVRKVEEYVPLKDIFSLAAQKRKYIYWKLMFELLLEKKKQNEPVLQYLLFYVSYFDQNEMLDCIRFVVKHWSRTERMTSPGAELFSADFVLHVLLRDKKISDAYIFEEYAKRALRNVFGSLLEGGTDMREILRYIYELGVDIVAWDLAYVENFRKNNVWDLWHQGVLRLEYPELIHLIEILIQERRPVELLEEVISLRPIEEYGTKFNPSKFNAALISTYANALKKDRPQVSFTQDLAYAVRFLEISVRWGFREPFVLLPYNTDLLEPFITLFKREKDVNFWRSFLYRAFEKKEYVDTRYIRFALSLAPNLDWKLMYIWPWQRDAWSFFRKFDPRPLWEYLLNSQLED